MCHFQLFNKSIFIVKFEFCILKIFKRKLIQIFFNFLRLSLMIVVIKINVENYHIHLFNFANYCFCFFFAYKKFYKLKIIRLCSNRFRRNLRLIDVILHDRWIDFLWFENFFRRFDKLLRKMKYCHVSWTFVLNDIENQNKKRNKIFWLSKYCKICHTIRFKSFQNTIMLN